MATGAISTQASEEYSWESLTLMAWSLSCCYVIVPLGQDYILLVETEGSRNLGGGTKKLSHLIYIARPGRI